MGASGSDLGENVVSNALQKSGGEIGRIAKQTTVNLDNQFVQDLINVADEVANMPKSLSGRTQANRLIDEFVDKAIQNGSISGQEQQVTRSVLRAASESGMRDPRTVPLARAQKGVKTALDEALYRSIPDAEEEALKTARIQYAAGKSVQDANPIAGNVSGPKLSEILRGNVRSDLRDAADATRAFGMGIPEHTGWSTGTVRNMLQSPLSGIGALAGAGAASDSESPYAIGGAAALGALFGPRVAQAAYYNPAVRAYLQNGLLMGREIPANVLAAFSKLAPQIAATELQQP
jgi:hypothetical protein